MYGTMTGMFDGEIRKKQLTYDADVTLSEFEGWQVTSYYVASLNSFFLA
jgi:hypothetical protein